MNDIPQGMNTYHSQMKDRENWQSRVEYRNELIKGIRHNNIKAPKRPHEMKIRELEKLLYG